MSNVKRLFDFLDFLHFFQRIFRKAPVKGRDLMETDAEHSFQLAMVGWYLIDKFGLELDKEKVFKYALSHDLVEIHSGDTDPYNAPDDYLKSKEEREERALRRIKGDWKEFKDLSLTLEDYGSMPDEESQFVYLLDKILPVMNTYLAGNKFYIESGVSFEGWSEWLASKEEKAGKAPDSIKVFIKELRAFLKKNSKDFFAKEKK